MGNVYEAIVNAGSILIRAKDLTYNELREEVPFKKDKDRDRLIEDVKQKVEEFELKLQGGAECEEHDKSDTNRV